MSGPAWTVWRWVRSRVLRRPAGWPVPVRRELVAELPPGRHELPRVPPSFMTASEHREWLREEQGRSNVAANGGVVLGDGWVARPAGWTSDQVGEWVRAVKAAGSNQDMQRALARQLRAAQGLFEEDDQRRREAQLAAMGAPGWAGWRK